MTVSYGRSCHLKVRGERYELTLNLQYNTSDLWFLAVSYILAHKISHCEVIKCFPSPFKPVIKSLAVRLRYSAMFCLQQQWPQVWHLVRSGTIIVLSVILTLTMNECLNLHRLLVLPQSMFVSIIFNLLRYEPRQILDTLEWAKSPFKYTK